MQKCKTYYSICSEQSLVRNFTEHWNDEFYTKRNKQSLCTKVEAETWKGDIS